jgi:hypothetical protein
MSMELNERLTDFYTEHLPEGVIDGTMMRGPCPFCKGKGRDEAGTIVVYLGARSYFGGYFRCQSRCVHGGFDSDFDRISGLDHATGSLMSSQQNSRLAI